MATQKQRKRRAKEKRHDYDLLYVDEDGVEQPVERDDAPRKPPSRLGRGTAVTKSQKTQPARKGGRRGREVQPPSWRRVLRRGAIFAPIFFVTVLLLSGKGMTADSARYAAPQTVLLIGVFVPFSYFMDRVVWRQQQKRLNKG